ncbi:NepR family anti-sigma factor [Paracoccaceae bacterium Fryx2]|nr:NepR family anti-sigma factor [Paracoccaceae bacterium Fryx2]
MTKKIKRDEESQGSRPARSALAKEIDANLKRVYAATLNEEVPERFRALLAQLREKEGKP